MLACEFKEVCWPKLILFLLLEDTLHKQKEELEVLHKKAVLKKFAKFTGKIQSLLKRTLIKKETSAHVFSCEFSEEQLFYRTLYTEDLSGVSYFRNVKQAELLFSLSSA